MIDLGAFWVGLGVMVVCLAIVIAYDWLAEHFPGWWRAAWRWLRPKPQAFLEHARNPEGQLLWCEQYKFHRLPKIDERIVRGGKLYRCLSCKVKDRVITTTWDCVG